MKDYSKISTSKLVDRLYNIDLEHEKLNIEYNKIIDELTKRIPSLDSKEGFQKVKVKGGKNE